MFVEEQTRCSDEPVRKAVLCSLFTSSTVFSEFQRAFWPAVSKVKGNPKGVHLISILMIPYANYRCYFFSGFEKLQCLPFLFSVCVFLWHSTSCVPPTPFFCVHMCLICQLVTSCVLCISVLACFWCSCLLLMFCALVFLKSCLYSASFILVCTYSF